MSLTIIVKKYEHWNKSFPNWDHPYKGKWIGSKEQYDKEMVKGGFVPFRETNPKESQWIPSADLKRKLNQVMSMGDKKGNIEVTDGYVKMLKDSGMKLVKKDLPVEKGGFDASD